MRTQSIQVIQFQVLRQFTPPRRVIASKSNRQAIASAGRVLEHTPYWQARAHHCRVPTAARRGSPARPREQ